MGAIHCPHNKGILFFGAWAGRNAGERKNSLKKAVQNKSGGARGDSKCVKLVTNIEIMKSENESENENENENESENE